MENNEGTTPVGGKAKGLLAYVKRVLNLGDEAKVENFIDRLIKKLEREKKTAEQAITILRNQLSNMEIEHSDAVEDAQANIRDQYSNIDLNRIKSNGDQNEYMEDYLDNIAVAERKLDALQKEHENLRKQVEKQIEEYEEHIKVRQERISKIQDFE